MNYQKEIQSRYADVLAKCYEQYQLGRRCLFEKIPEKSYDCSNCRNSDRNQFCKANKMLKKLIRLLAEGMAAKGFCSGDENAAATQGVQIAALHAAAPGAVITDEHIRNFKALNVAVAFSSPKSEETLWLVPERMGQSGIEFTPEDVRILEAAVNTFGGEILKARRLNKS